MKRHHPSSWGTAAHRKPPAAAPAEALFSHEQEAGEAAARAAGRFAVACDEAPTRGPVLVPSPVHAAHPRPTEAAVPAENGTGGE